MQLCNSTATTGISAARYCNYIATIATAASVTDSRQAFTLFNPQLAFQFDIIESREVVAIALRIRKQALKMQNFAELKTWNNFKKA